MEQNKFTIDFKKNSEDPKKEVSPEKKQKRKYITKKVVLEKSIQKPNLDFTIHF